MSKFQVAPTKSSKNPNKTSNKELSIPNLELMAALIGANLAQYIKTILTMPFQTYMWTDNMIVLSWIKQPRPKQTTFVKNRIKKIRKLTCSHNWAHCIGELNSADMATRSNNISISKLQNFWLSGLEWLQKTNWNWPSDAKNDSASTLINQISMTPMRLSKTPVNFN